MHSWATRLEGQADAFTLACEALQALVALHANPHALLTAGPLLHRFAAADAQALEIAKRIERQHRPDELHDPLVRQALAYLKNRAVVLRGQPVETWLLAREREALAAVTPGSREAQRLVEHFVCHEGLPVVQQARALCTAVDADDADAMEKLKSALHQLEQRFTALGVDPAVQQRVRSSRGAAGRLWEVYRSALARARRDLAPRFTPLEVLDDELPVLRRGLQSAHALMSFDRWAALSLADALFHRGAVRADLTLLQHARVVQLSRPDDAETLRRALSERLRQRELHSDVPVHARETSSPVTPFDPPLTLEAAVQRFIG